MKKESGAIRKQIFQGLSSAFCQLHTSEFDELCNEIIATIKNYPHEKTFLQPVVEQLEMLTRGLKGTVIHSSKTFNENEVREMARYFYYLGFNQKNLPKMIHKEIDEIFTEQLNTILAKYKQQ